MLCERQVSSIATGQDRNREIGPLRRLHLSDGLFFVFDVTGNLNDLHAILKSGGNCIGYVRRADEKNLEWQTDSNSNYFPPDFSLTPWKDRLVRRGSDQENSRSAQDRASREGPMPDLLEILALFCRPIETKKSLVPILSSRVKKKNLVNDD